MNRISTAMQDFIHPKLGREVTAISGHYVFNKEILFSFNSREVLYFVGYAVLDSACCGFGGCAYVLVAGFIRQWKYKKNKENSFISQVESIKEPGIQKQVRTLIQKKESVFQVKFGFYSKLRGLYA